MSIMFDFFQVNILVIDNQTSIKLIYFFVYFVNIKAVNYSTGVCFIALVVRTGSVSL